MTLSSTASSISYSGNDATTPFSFPYLFLLDGDLEVILSVDATGVETVQTITTEYTVTGAGVQAGGTVTMVTAPATGETLLIQRIVNRTQGLDLVENDEFPSEQVEQALDRLTMINQTDDERYGRTLHVQRTDTYDGGEPHIPIRADRLNNILGFDANGDMIAVTLATLGAVAASTINPLALGAVAVGVATAYSREDHVHPTTGLLLAANDLSDVADAPTARGNIGAGTLDDVFSDATPQLGGPLDTNGRAINESEGAPVVAATTTDIFGGDDGNTIHITGNTQIDDFTDASSVGQWRKIIFDGTPQLTSGSGITVVGGTQMMAAGDMALVYADAVDAFTAFILKADGTAVVAGGGAFTQIAYDEDLTPASTSSASYVDTGAFVTITGVMSGKNVYVEFTGVTSQATISNNHGIEFEIRRDTTSLLQASMDAHAGTASAAVGSVVLTNSFSARVKDAAHGGGTVTYRLYWRAASASTIYLGRDTGNSNNVATIGTAMEEA